MLQENPCCPGLLGHPCFSNIYSPQSSELLELGGLGYARSTQRVDFVPLSWLCTQAGQHPASSTRRRGVQGVPTSSFQSSVPHSSVAALHAPEGQQEAEKLGVSQSSAYKSGEVLGSFASSREDFYLPTRQVKAADPNPKFMGKLPRGDCPSLARAEQRRGGPWASS